MMRILPPLLLSLALTAGLAGAEFTKPSLIAELATMKTVLAGATQAGAKAFITTYCDPEELKVITAGGRSVDDIASAFVKDGNAKEILGMLGAVDLAAGEVDEAAKIISFKAKEGTGSAGRIRFKFASGHWYMMND